MLGRGRETEALGYEVVARRPSSQGTQLLLAARARARAVRGSVFPAKVLSSQNPPDSQQMFPSLGEQWWRQRQLLPQSSPEQTVGVKNLALPPCGLSLLPTGEGGWPARPLTRILAFLLTCGDGEGCLQQACVGSSLRVCEAALMS